MSQTKFKGSVVNLVGNELNVGDLAPVVTVVNTELKDIEIGGSGDRVQLIVAIPSLDTGVCAKETKRFNMEVGSLDIVDTFVVSMDLPFASQRFCTTEGVANLSVVSDYVNKDFSTKYGVLMSDGVLKGLCARAVFVINKDGLITYKEIVEEVTSEPDYDKVLEAIKDARI